jgi:hypothetical protein
LDESSQEISNDNGARVVIFVTSKTLVIKSTMFPHRSIHKYTWNTPDGQTHNKIEHVSTDWRSQVSVIDVRSFRGADCDTGHYLVIAKIRKRLAVSKAPVNNKDMDRFNLKTLRMGFRLK